ncbi:MAG TPA: DNA-binding response regulator [Clostridium sp.]|nr:DNA-binding response regulator [Clostridium sp.]
MFNVLVIDDEKEIAELIEIYLTNSGYKVFKCYNGNNGLLLLEKEHIDLVILDIMMPGIDGYDTCIKIRQENNIPVIMISAKSQTMDKIKGLSLGADDYITKPFEPMELVARVQSQLRRFIHLNKSIESNQNNKNNSNEIKIHSLTIYRDNHKVLKYEKEIKLTPTEYDILILLANNRGKVYSAENIYKEIWKEKYFDGNNTVMAHMWRLREKIEDNPKNPSIVQTVWGVGYKIDE